MIRYFDLPFGRSAALFLATLWPLGSAQASQEYPSRLPSLSPQILEHVDDNRTVVLRGNTHPLATLGNDRGAVTPDQPMRRMLILIHRRQQQETALSQLLAAQQDPRSPDYHKWLTPDQFGTFFGPAPRDVETVTNWLASRGFSDVKLSRGRTVIEFSGNAAQVQGAFHTSIRRYEANGGIHIANQIDPSIPVALAPVVSGVVSMNDFGRRSMAVRGPMLEVHNGQLHPLTTLMARPDYSIIGPTLPSSFFGVAPYDFATIYNLLPLWNAGLDGTGQTIAIVGETDISLSDVTNFRSFLGLPANATSVLVEGADPGVQPDELEADLDVEWSGAVAKGANINLVASASTEASAGVDLSALYIVDNNLAPVMSDSYGECELFLGATGNAFYSALWQQAAAEGITVLVASGDQGSAACDPTTIDQNLAVHPMAVSGLASTPYNTAVGGTDFNQYGAWTQYWSQTNDPTTKESALSYIPEIPWNDSCGSAIVDAFYGDNPNTACNSGSSGATNLNTIATGGGPSSCVTSDGTNATSCKSGWPKPLWQSGNGVPADGVRDIPDVSLFSGDSLYQSAYVVCDIDFTKQSGCDPSAASQAFVAVGGTSASAPALAGVMAIINQKYGRQGNANYNLYRLASGSSAASIFHDITLSGNRVACTNLSSDCEVPSGATEPIGRTTGHDATAGYDMATGLGSFDIANLINDWSSVTYLPTKVTLDLNGGTNAVSAVHGTGLNAAVQVSASSGTPGGDVSLSGATANGSVFLGPLQNGATVGSVSSLPGGSYAVTAHYAGDGQFAPSDSTPVNVNITPETSSTRVSIFNYDQTQSAFVPPPSTVPYGSLLMLRADINGASGIGNATGSATISDGSTLLGQSALNPQGSTEVAPNILLLGGTHAITASFGGDPSFKASNSPATNISVTPAPMTCRLYPNTTYLRPGWVLVADAEARIYQASLSPTLGTMVPPTGTLNIYSGSTLVSGPTSGTGIGSGTVSSGGFVIPGIYAVTSVPASSFTSNDSITISYSGDANYAPCTSQPLQIPYQTSLLGSQITLTLSQYQGILRGTSVTATATIASSLPLVVDEPPFPIPTGAYQLSIDGVPVGTPIQIVPVGPQQGGLNATASLTIPTSGLASGMHTVTQTYSGDANYLPTQGGQINIWVVAPDFSVSSNTTYLTVVNGQATGPVTLQVSHSDGFTGNVSFSCSGLPSQASCVFQPTSVTTSGSTTLTIATTQAQVFKGGYSARNQTKETGVAAALGGISTALIFVLRLPKRRRRALLLIYLATTTVFFGVASCGGGSSGSSSPPPTLNSTFTSLAASSNAPAKGVSDTFTATVTTNGSTAIPTGTVQFSVDGAASGTPVGLTQGGAQLQTAFSTAGSHIVTAAYSGDANNLSSTSGQLAVLVPYSSGSLPGTYSVTIAATSGSITHTVPLSLQVN
jgi:hypothetical protein